MLHNFNLLPVELQADIIELRSAGVNDDFIDRHVGRMLGALETKSNKLQVDVWQIEESLSRKIDLGYGKLQADLQTQHGATNAMLVDLRSAQQHAHPQIAEARQDVADIKKLWAGMLRWQEQVDHWRELLDGRFEELSDSFSSHETRLDDMVIWRAEADREIASFRQSRDESKTQRARTEAAVHAIAEQLQRFITRIDALIAQTPEQAIAYRAFLDDLMRDRAQGT